MPVNTLPLIPRIKDGVGWRYKKLRRHWLHQYRNHWSAEALGSKKLLRRLRQSRAGRRCFIIGNGPSLQMDDLRRLKNEVTIGCNGLFLAYEQMGYAPTFYTVEDRLVAEDRAREINRLTGSTKIIPRDLRYCLDRTPQMAWIDFLRDYESFPLFSSDLGQKAYWGGTVTYLNLQLAWHIGCREIYLIGIDHNYKVPDYATEAVITSREADCNHFHPDYFGPGYRYHDPKVWRMEQAYVQAREFAAAHAGVIYNSTRGGHLEVFPRVAFDSLFPPAV